MAKSTAGTKICIIKDGATTGVSVTATGATKAAPVEISTGSTGALANNDLIWIPKAGTGLDEIDGEWWVISNLVADTSFDLLIHHLALSDGLYTSSIIWTCVPWKTQKARARTHTPDHQL